MPTKTKTKSKNTSTKIKTDHESRLKYFIIDIGYDLETLCDDISNGEMSPNRIIDRIRSMTSSIDHTVDY
jgi:hypothetical protein